MTFAVWAVIVMAAGFAGSYMGYGGRRFALALVVAAALFAFELFLAVPDVLARIESMLGSAAPLAVLYPLAAVLGYSLLVVGNWKTALGGAAYVLAPVLLAGSSSRRAAGAWQDYAAAVCLWLPLWAQWLYWMFPYPPPLTHVLSILLALATGVTAFILVRRLDDAGYSLEWRRGFGFNFGFNLLVFAAIAIPLGIKIHFITYAPSINRAQPLVLIGILFFTAWPEEFLFRGILQNLLSRSFSNEWAGLIVASIIFGLSHILHPPFPNWKYVLLASIAGFFYGRAWMKTKSLVP
ncbi:MAG TPA: type II CAAX endopeptidase family protein, partial [Candidatus Acidoferrales bacterium]|nr:type II CAAX endopeptidase family protein [Candidatus Acidoferrales bacterium]